MPKPIQHFLLVFDHTKDQLVELREFGTEAERATAEYGAAERKYRDQDAIDIVLVGSDSIETVKVTHSTYFEGIMKSELSKFLRLDRVPVTA